MSALVLLMGNRAMRRIRSAILTARHPDGMHVVAMIYGNGHDSLWMRAYGRSTPAGHRSFVSLRRVAYRRSV